MTEFLTLAGTDANDIAVIGIIGGIALVGILAGVLHSMFETRQYEKSRREIAAYVAEGSMTPEEGERLLRVGTEDN